MNDTTESSRESTGATPRAVTTQCPRCKRDIRTRDNGTLYVHGPRDNRCGMSGQTPRKVETVTGPTTYARRILAALQGKPMYAGTVPAHVKARRRAKNKVARKVNTRRLIAA